MTNPLGQTSVPAAWYPDPADARQLRYWDGIGWTGQMAPNPQTPVVAAQGFATPTSAPRHILEPITGSSAFVPMPSTMVDPDYSYVPMLRGTSPSGTVRVKVPDGPTSTPAIWLYVFVPLLALPFLVIGPAVDPGDVWSFARAGLLGLMVVALAVLAGIDRASLLRREVLNSPTALVGIIPLVFMIERTRRVGRSGAGVLVTSLLVQAAVGAALVARLYPVLV